MIGIHPQVDKILLPDADITHALSYAEFLAVSNMKTLSKDLLFCIHFLVIVFVDLGVTFDEDNETLEGKSYFEAIQILAFSLLVM